MALPGKIFYSFFEVAERWDVPLDELLHWGISGHIVFCFNYIGEAAPLDEANIEMNASQDGISVDATFTVVGCVPLPSTAIYRILTEGDTPLVFALKDGGIGAAVRSITREGAISGYELQNDRIMTGDDLVVMADEVDRMEKEYPDLLAIKGKIGAGETSPWRPVPARTERTDIHIIGGMLELLLGEAGQTSFKSDAEIITTLIERCPGLPGMSKRTLEERFCKAKKAINDPEE